VVARGSEEMDKTLVCFACFWNLLHFKREAKVKGFSQSGSFRACECIPWCRIQKEIQITH